MAELYIVIIENNVCGVCPKCEFILQVVDRHYYD